MRKQNMSFQLGITFEDVEVKGIKIDLNNFLGPIPKLNAVSS